MTQDIRKSDGGGQEKNKNNHRLVFSVDGVLKGLEKKIVNLILNVSCSIIRIELHVFFVFSG